MTGAGDLIRQLLPVQLLAAGLTLLGCGGGSGAPPSGAVPSREFDPALQAVGSSEGRFVGSEACAPCHREIVEAWRGSRHRMTLRPVGESVVPRLAGTVLPEGYTWEADGSVTGLGPDGTAVRARPAYLVGGRHREDLWVRMDDGRLQVYPVSFDVDAGRPFEPLRELAGGNSPPGDATDHWTRFGRNADLVCYGCHATGSRVENAEPTSAAAVPRSRWAEAGVGCEGCHGPGAAHVEGAKAGRPTGAAGLRMVRGAPAEDAVAACASCHGLRETFASPFDSAPAHAYGAPVWERAEALARLPLDFEFRSAAFADLRPGTYQQEAIALGQSECVRKGGLTCGACHDPHSGALAAAASGPDGGDAACLACHAPIGLQGRAHSGHEPGKPGGRCFDCHLAPIVRGPGREPARDHTLAAPAAGPGEFPAACAVCHRGPAASRLVENWGARRPEGRSAARRMALARAFGRSKGVLDIPARALGKIAADPAEAWFVRSAALTRAMPLLEAGRGRELAASARAALASEHPAVRRAAARALAWVGDDRDTVALVAFLDGPDPSLALDAALALLGRGEPGAGARLTAVVRRPDLLGEYRAHLALARAAIIARDWSLAESELTTALELNPLHVSAWNDLGIARFSSGSAGTARAAWDRALALNPRFDAARRNLDAVGPVE